jgi:hypothetical protein
MTTPPNAFIGHQQIRASAESKPWHIMRMKQFHRIHQLRFGLRNKKYVRRASNFPGGIGGERFVQANVTVGAAHEF